MPPVRLAFLALLTLLPRGMAAQQSRGFEGILGDWYGSAAIAIDSGLPVSVELRLSETNGALHALLTLPESRQTELELPSPYSDSAGITWDGRRLRLDFTPDIGLGFLNVAGVAAENQRIVLDVEPRDDMLVGTLTITVKTGRLTLRRGRPPMLHREEAASFRSTEDDLLIHGVLVRPLQGEHHPAVVFITGSDPDTWTRWRLEADRLAQRGVATLLYDKRGVGGSVGASHDLASWDDLAGDAEGGLEYLRARADVIDTARIGLVGQSQGTWMISKIAARNPHVAFVVNISGGAMSGAEQETYRTGALMRRAGFSDSAVQRAIAFQRQKFAVARTGIGWNALDSLMQQLRRDSVSWFPGYGTGAAARTLASLRLYGVLQFNYDPRPDLSRVRVPVLLLLGERDVVFPPDTVAARMRAVLPQPADLTVHILPGTSHGMTVPQSSGGQPFRWVIDPRFLDLFADWVAEKTAASRPGDW